MLMKEYLRMAIDSIRSNKMRALLTMLGIIIGIASVITIIAAGDGVRAYMNSQLEAVGTNTVIISVDTEEGSENDLITNEDIEALLENEMVRAATPQLTGYGTGSFRKSTIMASIYCGTEGMETANGVSMVSGSFFTESDNLSARNVCVIDDVVAQKFFGTTDVIGLEVTLEYKDNMKSYRIVGVCKSPYSGFVTDDMLDSLPGTFYVPLNSGLTLLNEKAQYSSLYLISNDKSQNSAMSDTAVRILEARHNNAGRSIYYSQDLSSQLDMINDVMGLVTNFIAAVAAISLVVGGIGVMNIMLVSVTERTREIGIRKSLGAKRKDIRLQFIIEAGTTSALGGLIGVVLGMVVAFVAGVVLSGMMTSMMGGSGTTFQAVPTPGAVAIAFGVSVGIGVLFGYLPANKAAKMNPIDALRYE